MMVQGNSQGDLPIHSALNTGQTNVVDALVSWLKQLQGTTNDDVAVNQVLGQNNLEGNTALHIALEFCKENNVRDLVDLYPPASYVINNEGICPLYMAIKKELTGLVQHMLLKLQPFQEDALGCLLKGQSVLHAAVNAKRTEMLDCLLNYDRKLITLLDKEGWTALSHAACQGHIEKVQIFHTRAEDSALVRNKDKSFPIHQAVLGGHLSIISLLISSRFLLNGKDQNILHLATSTGNSEMVSHVLSLPNVDSLINQNDEDGNTPLHLATLAKHVNVVEILIQCEVVNVGLSNKEGSTASDLAKKLTFADDVEKSVVQRLDLMLERVTRDIKCFPIDGKLYQLLVNHQINELYEIVSARRIELKDLLTPGEESNVLHIAASVDNTQLVYDLLMGHNCATLMYQANKKGDLPIHSAVKAGKLRSLKALFQSSSIPAERICERRNMDGNTALHVAVLNNQRAIANYLYQLCPQAAYCLNKDNICPLFLAVMNWETTEINLINSMIQGLEDNVQLQKQLKSAKSVVHIAIFVENKAILKSIFVRARDLFDSTDCRGRSPLSYAALRGNVEGVELILKNIPDLEFKRNEDKEGSYPIHQAVKGGNVEVIKLLHPEICLLNCKGQNILHVAAETGRFAIVEYLLKLQAFKELLNTGDDGGNTPLHLAVKAVRPRAVYRLLQHHEHNQVNSMNKELMTAQDLWTKSQKEKAPSKTQILLMNAMLAVAFGRIHSILSKRRDDRGVNGKNGKIKREKEQRKKNCSSSNSSKGSTVKKRANTLLVVATLIISVAFGAAFSPPGGYDAKTGLPTLWKTENFQEFVFFNNLAIGFAVLSAVLLLMGMNTIGFVRSQCILAGGAFLLWAMLFMSMSLFHTSPSNILQLCFYVASLFVLVFYYTILVFLLESGYKRITLQLTRFFLLYCPSDEAKPDITI